MDSDQLRFRHIGLSSDRTVIFCELDNGRSYALPIGALDVAEEWEETSKPKAAAIIHDGYAAVVKFDGGVKIDFPADFVLHVCEPSYGWHKDKARARSRIGARIREIRQARGLTLDALAAKCGIAKPNLSRLEHGKVTPRYETLRTVAAALDTHPSLLMQKHPWTQTRHEFIQWQRGLQAKNGEAMPPVSGKQMVESFLATRPEHRYAYDELLEYAAGARKRKRQDVGA